MQVTGTTVYADIAMPQYVLSQLTSVEIIICQNYKTLLTYCWFVMVQYVLP